MDERDEEVSAEVMAARLAAGLDRLAGLMETRGAAGSLPAFAAQMRAMRDDARSLAEAVAEAAGDGGDVSPEDQAASPAEAMAGQPTADAGAGPSPLLDGLPLPTALAMLAGGIDALAMAAGKALTGPQRMGPGVLQAMAHDGAAMARDLRGLAVMANETNASRRDEGEGSGLDWQAAKAAADAAAEAERRAGGLTMQALRLALDVLAHGARRQVDTMAGRNQAERQEAAEGVEAAYARLGVTLAALDRFAARLHASEDPRGRKNECWKAEHPDFWAVANATDATHQLACSLGSVPIGALSALGSAMVEVSIGQKPRLFAAEKTTRGALGHIDAAARGYAALAVVARVRSCQPAKSAAEAVAAACRDRTPGEVLRWYRNAPDLTDLARGNDPGTERQTGGKGPTRDAMVRLARECFAIGAPRAATTPEGWRRIAEEIETRLADLYGRRHALAWRRRRDDPSRFPSPPLRRELSGPEE